VPSLNTGDLACAQFYISFIEVLNIALNVCILASTSVPLRRPTMMLMLNFALVWDKTGYRVGTLYGRSPVQSPNFKHLRSPRIDSK
jgi:hypothetical protein